MSELKGKVVGKAGLVPSDDLVEVFGGDTEDGGDVEIEEDKLPTNEAGMRGKTSMFHINGSASLITDDCNTRG